MNSALHQIPIPMQLCTMIIVFIGLSPTLHQAAQGVEDAPLPLDKTAAKRPVILLTGFEPFGKGRPPNSSWEGIKQLDGTEWNGYQLVSKQIPVVWGAPLDHLQRLIFQYEPVAIFSFGQGGKGAFALEGRASNVRNGKTDNRGQTPRTPTIGRRRSSPAVPRGSPPARNARSSPPAWRKRATELASRQMPDNIFAKRCSIAWST
jgi:hypothetical protein